MAYYYDYKKDFPSGNGWKDSQGAYTGVVIYDCYKFYFHKGKYKGKCLYDVFEKCWKGIIQYIDFGLILITKDCFDVLDRCEKKKHLSYIKAANDAKFYFNKINTVDDILFTRPFPCCYQGETLLDVAQKDPKYIAELINRTSLKYGENWFYYASDHISSKLDIEVIKDLGIKLDKQGNKNILTAYLDEIWEWVWDCKTVDYESRNYPVFPTYRYFEDDSYYRKLG